MVPTLFIFLLAAEQASGLTITVGQLLAILVPVLGFFGYVLRGAMKVKDVEGRLDARIAALELIGDERKVPEAELRAAIVNINQTLLSIQQDIGWLRGVLGEPGARTIPHPAWTKKP